MRDVDLVQFVVYRNRPVCWIGCCCWSVYKLCPPLLETKLIVGFHISIALIGTPWSVGRPTIETIDTHPGNRLIVSIAKGVRSRYSNRVSIGQSSVSIASEWAGLWAGSCGAPLKVLLR